VAEIKWVTVFFDVPADRRAAAEALWRQRAGAVMSERRGPDGEFATFVPADGDPYLRVQRVRDGPGGVHIDLHTDDTEALLADALRLGATATRADLLRLGLRSPAGAPFCVVGWRGEQARPSRRPVRHVTLRVAEQGTGPETQFWAALTRQGIGPDGHVGGSAGWPVTIRISAVPGASQAHWWVGLEPPKTGHPKERT
jgi:hypothetical protein